jgi:hypothetical protein
LHDAFVSSPAGVGQIELRSGHVLGRALP